MGSTSKSKNKSGGKTKTYRRHRAGTEIAEKDHSEWKRNRDRAFLQGNGMVFGNFAYVLYKDGLNSRAFTKTTKHACNPYSP